MQSATNPVLQGFYADPSLVRVGDGYYLATSTFEWFPGVCLLHSTDLVHWRELPGALGDDTLVPLEGLEPSCGVWAPSLTYCGGLFYLCYTIVQTNRYRFKDTHNYLITAPSIEGPWSKPVYLNCAGFDPSLFHAADGRKYLVYQTMEHRTRLPRFRGISMQEFDPAAGRLVGEARLLFAGTERGTPEGPNLLYRDGRYYLTLAEGGTEFGHCVTVARSEGDIWGPYTPDPAGPMVTSSGTGCALQRAGHGQLFTDPAGRWYIAHLCSRPIEGKYSTLGRETAIQNVAWSADGWPRLAGGGNAPEVRFTPPVETTTPDCAQPPLEGVTRFDAPAPSGFLTLRRGAAKNGLDYTARPGWLRIQGGNSLASHFRQGLLARRVTGFGFECTTHMQFSPRCPGHNAGLALYYNCDNHFYLHMSQEDGAPVLYLTAVDNGQPEDVACAALPEGTSELWLRAVGEGAALRFSFSTNGKSFVEAGPALDMTVLSDERVNGNGFTGAMAALCCQDLQGDGVFADFAFLEYHNR